MFAEKTKIKYEGVVIVCVYAFKESGKQKRRWWIVDPVKLNKANKNKSSSIDIHLNPTKQTKRDYVLKKGEGYKSLLCKMCESIQEDSETFPLEKHGELIQKNNNNKEQTDVHFILTFVPFPTNQTQTAQIFGELALNHKKEHLATLIAQKYAEDAAEEAGMKVTFGRPPTQGSKTDWTQTTTLNGKLIDIMKVQGKKMHFAENNASSGSASVVLVANIHTKNLGSREQPYKKGDNHQYVLTGWWKGKATIGPGGKFPSTTSSGDEDDDEEEEDETLYGYNWIIPESVLIAKGIGKQW
jgi:hypothetical protein